MASLNKVTLIGNLGSDPAVRTFGNGGKVVNFSVAVSESWKDKNTGEKKERTEWCKVAIFNESLGGVAERYLRKGSKVYLEGKMQTRKYQDREGKDVYTTEVVLQGFDCKLLMLGGREDGQRSGGDSGGSSGGNADWGSSGGGSNDIPEDDLPF